MVINGRQIASSVLEKLASKIQLLKTQHNLLPSLRVIMVGVNHASQIYVNNKKAKALAIGIDCEICYLPENIKEEELLLKIAEFNNSPEVHGIIVQLPLPNQINPINITNAINPAKDVDGFHPLNLGKLYSGQNTDLIACTPLGCLYLLQQVEPNLAGKHAVVIGRSNIVGRPLAALLLNHNLTVTICHSHTQNLQQISKNADIVICAVGKIHFFGKEYFNSNAIVIDVGISRDSEGKIAGDVKFPEVAPNVRKITPVPGGVGPMTIACLLENTVKAAIIQNNLKQ